MWVSPPAPPPLPQEFVTSGAGASESLYFLLHGTGEQL
jgi:hypothetical protein